MALKGRHVSHIAVDDGGETAGIKVGAQGSEPRGVKVWEHVKRELDAMQAGADGQSDDILNAKGLSGDSQGAPTDQAAAIAEAKCRETDQHGAAPPDLNTG
jgi:hypothetical protein